MNPSQTCWLLWCRTISGFIACLLKKPTWNRCTLRYMKKGKVCNELPRYFCYCSKGPEGGQPKQRRDGAHHRPYRGILCLVTLADQIITFSREYDRRFARRYREIALTH